MLQLQAHDSAQLREQFDMDRAGSYEPMPVNVRALALPRKLEALVQPAAAAVHQAWVQGLVAQGWRHGSGCRRPGDRRPWCWNTCPTGSAT